MKSNKFEPVVVGRFANIIWITVGFILALVTIRISYTPTYEFFFEHEMHLNRKALLKRLKRGPAPEFVGILMNSVTRWKLDDCIIDQFHDKPYLISMIFYSQHTMFVSSFDGIGYMSNRLQRKINSHLREANILHSLRADRKERDLKVKMFINKLKILDHKWTKRLEYIDY